MKQEENIKTPIADAILIILGAPLFIIGLSILIIGSSSAVVLFIMSLTYLIDLTQPIMPKIIGLSIFFIIFLSALLYKK